VSSLYLSGFPTSDVAEPTTTLVVGSAVPPIPKKERPSVAFLYPFSLSF